MALEFSAEIKQTATVFKEYRNSIDIYTEDRDKDKEFYVKLLKRLLADDPNVEINDIHPLGCRNTVIDYCLKDTDTRRKKLYIVDGDIYLQYREKENIANLYVHDAYCIENYMICEDAICNVAYNLHAQDSYDNVKNALNVPQALNDITESLVKLFFYYSIQMECYGKFDIRYIDAYMDMTTKHIDSSKIGERIAEIRDGLIQYGIPQERINDLLKNREAKFPYNESTLLRIVSGKNFLIPFFKHHTEKQLNYSFKISEKSWKFNLVDKCDISRLEPLKQAILSA